MTRPYGHPKQKAGTNEQLTTVSQEETRPPGQNPCVSDIIQTIAIVTMAAFKRLPWPETKMPNSDPLTHAPQSSVGWRPDKLFLAYDSNMLRIMLTPVTRHPTVGSTTTYGEIL